MSDQVSVKVSADSSAFSAGLARVENSLEAFKHHTSEQFADLGKDLLDAFALTAVVESIKSLFEQFSQVQDLANRLGTTAESVQRLGEVAKESGVETEVLFKTLQKGTTNAYQAATGNEALAEAFDAIAVDAKEFANAAPEEQLTLLAEGFEKAGFNAQTLNAAQTALGKTSREILGLLAKGPDELKESLEGAKVASNETVATLKETTEKFEKMWASLKAYGADALDYLIKRVEALGTGFAAITAYVSNLTHGLDAAAKAYDDVIQAAADLQLEQDKKRDEEAKKRKPVDTDAIEAANQKAEAEKKGAEEVAKLKEQNAKKEEEAHMRSLSLLQKQKELQEDIYNLTRDKAFSRSPLESEQYKGRILDYQKELEGVNKDIDREEERAAKERTEKAKKQMTQQTREELEARRKELKGAEDWLKDLDSRKQDFSVDSLRQVGGGIAGANYKVDTARLDMQRQQIDYAKQQVEKLTLIVDTLKKQEQTIQSYDGSFS